MATFHENLVQSFKNFKNKYIGNTSIAGIGDGTLTSAVNTINQRLTDMNVFRTSFTNQSGWLVNQSTIYYFGTSKPTLASATIAGERALTSSELELLNASINLSSDYSIIIIQTANATLLNALAGKTVVGNYV